jgi:hypothetical protein
LKTPGLDAMMVTQKGSRLSVQPVTKAEFDIVARLGRRTKDGRPQAAARCGRWHAVLACRGRGCGVTVAHAHTVARLTYSYPGARMSTICLWL